LANKKVSGWRLKMSAHGLVLKKRDPRKSQQLAVENVSAAARIGSSFLPFQKLFCGCC
jgi:hypothetical protein